MIGTDVINVCFDEDDIFNMEFTELQKILIRAGKDCTHRWDGTTLTVTSASGTSSADLKGETGVGIAGFEIEFYVSDTDTYPSGGEWVSEIPDAAPGKYLWTRYVVSFSDNGTSYSSPVRSPMWETVNSITTDIRSHISDLSNPHSITPAGIGAAPSGYGLGGVAKTLTTFEELDSALECGWYLVLTREPSDAMTLDGFSFSAAHVFVSASSGGAAVQEMTVYDTNYKLIRTILDGTASAWEWVTPPMIPGYEYRTTERYLNKSVYTKLLDCGALPNATYKDVSAGVTMTNIVSLNIVATDADNNWRYQLPYIAPNGDSRCVANVVGYSVRIYAINYDMSGYTGKAVIKYTKD